MVKSFRYTVLLVLLLFILSCESNKKHPPNGYIPNSPTATEQLEAQYFWVAQDKISSSYWKDANFVELSLSDKAKQNLYPDGYLNMTGTYNGLSDFNEGNAPMATIKAGYDDQYIYFLVEWKDTTADASYQAWVWDGPEDEHKSDSSTGWTSQRNQDNVTLLFETENSTEKDAWRWSLAYTAPFDMALNLSADANGELIESGKLPFIRNASDESGRTGPLYEWNGERQEIELPDGSIKIMDPAYYLSDDHKIEFLGNMNAGSSVFNFKADCKYCHGINGDGFPTGEAGNGGALDNPFTNKYSREGLVVFIDSKGHPGRGLQYWGKIKNNPEDVENMLAFMRGIAGVPGHTLKYEEDLSDIHAISNIIVGGIEVENSEYKVLFKRKLETTNSDDVNFDPATTYNFTVQFSDNDEINYIGSSTIELVFKSNEL